MKCKNCGKELTFIGVASDGSVYFDAYTCENEDCTNNKKPVYGPSYDIPFSDVH
jgi:hypothetical protein